MEENKTRINTDTDDLLSSMMLWSGSNRYLETARTLFAQEEPSLIPTPPSEPVYFLACQAIELALKAYLRGSGKDEVFLVHTCKHNLLITLKAAEENGLTDILKLEPEERSVLDLANRLYSSKALQFAIAGRYHYPAFEPLLQIAEKLIAKTEAFCMENVEHHAGKPTAVRELRSITKARRG
jgi:HEPN domain-containing protein